MSDDPNRPTEESIMSDETDSNELDSQEGAPPTDDAGGSDDVGGSGDAGGADDAGASHETPPESEGPTGAAAVFGPFFNAILAPAQCWEALDAKPKLAAWIVVWIAVFSTVLAVINLPISQQIMVQSAQASQRAAGQEMSAEQAQGMADMMTTMGTVFAYGSSLVILLLIAFTALIIWVIASIMGGTGSTFGRAFGVAAGAAVIRPFLYSIYATVILNMNPPEIRRPEDASTITPTLGLDLLLAGPDTPVWLNVIYQRFDLFNFWWLALIVSGSMAILKLRQGQAITLAALMWFVGTLFAVGMAMLQSLASR